MAKRSQAFFSRQTDAQLPQGEAMDVQVKFIGNPGGGFGAVETMVMTNSLPWKPWPIYRGLPIKNGDFPWQTVSHNQMVINKGVMV